MLTLKILSPGDGLEDAFDVRTRVFVEEQGFSPELEIDATDSLATHVVFYEDDMPVATGRVFANEENSSEYVIGRVAVLKPYRKGGTGRALMSALEGEAVRLGAESARLGAQCRAREFYSKCGYSEYGEIYYDEHCPHIYMRKDFI